MSVEELAECGMLSELSPTTEPGTAPAPTFLKRLSAEHEAAMRTLRLIADRKRRTQEQRLASACVQFLDALKLANP